MWEILTTFTLFIEISLKKEYPLTFNHSISDNMICTLQKNCFKEKKKITFCVIITKERFYSKGFVSLLVVNAVHFLMKLIKIMSFLCFVFISSKKETRNLSHSLLVHIYVCIA